jgi:(2R)-3-sulfolactate dehydrogenase (NADP+)
VLAEAQGISSHGLSRVSQYVAHLRNGRANGQAVPQVVKDRLAAAAIDAQSGLAFPACALAVQEAIDRSRRYGISIVGVVNSHHAGVIVDHLRPVAAAGLIGLAFANSPAAMPVAGGKRALLGTNPIAAIFPRANASPVMIDLSLSEVARGKIMTAANKGEQIPLGWAVDAQGVPTTDPRAALAGAMLPLGAGLGSPKGAVLALTVELLASALIGAQFAPEASSFFVEDGNQPKLGQTFIVIDPEAVNAGRPFSERLEQMLAWIVEDECRVPGSARESKLATAKSEGIEVDARQLNLNPVIAPSSGTHKLA